MMLFSRMVTIDMPYMRTPSASVMSTGQPRRDETVARKARASNARERAKARGQSHLYEHRPVIEGDGRRASLQQHRVQAEDDGVVLLCRD